MKQILGGWYLILLCTVGQLALGSVARAQNDASNPQWVVESASQQILAVLDARREELAADSAALYAAVDEVLNPRFDLVYAGRVVLGRYGRDASTEQRRRFINAFYQSLLRTYAKGLLEFQADNLRMLPYRGEDTETKTRVRTEVILNDGRVIPVDYSLRLTDAGWKAYDVTIEGISYLTNYRKEVAGLIRDKGLEAVIVDLESRVAKQSDSDG